jgi:hypothetical protein
VLNAAEGTETRSEALGQAITEIRAVEIDGQPAAREFVVGGKNGGVWAYHISGKQLWSRSISDRVTDIAALDANDDGAEDVLVGDESGNLVLFIGELGSRETLASARSAISAIGVGRLSGAQQFVVADGGEVWLASLARTNAPFWYSPLLAGLLISVVIAVGAWFVATMPAKPVLRAAAEDQSPEGLLSRRTMLHESLADVERLRQSGEMPSSAYIARLRELREQLADTEAALRKAGASIRVETFKCPGCGGALPLGLDRCDYCGQVVIR